MLGKGAKARAFRSTRVALCPTPKSMSLAESTAGVRERIALLDGFKVLLNRLLVVACARLFCWECPLASIFVCKTCNRPWRRWFSSLYCIVELYAPWWSWMSGAGCILVSSNCRWHVRLFLLLHCDFCHSGSDIKLKCAVCMHLCRHLSTKATERACCVCTQTGIDFRWTVYSLYISSALIVCFEDFIL